MFNIHFMKNKYALFFMMIVFTVFVQITIIIMILIELIMYARIIQTDDISLIIFYAQNML